MALMISYIWHIEIHDHDKGSMEMRLVVDDRVNPAHTIRSGFDRRRNRIQFHLLRKPVIDSHGMIVTIDRRRMLDRRNRNPENNQNVFATPKDMEQVMPFSFKN